MKLYNINELKDSKIFFDKNPPPFLLIFLWFCFFLLILTIIGTNFITKSYVVKGQGQFIYEDRTYITPPTNGEIKQVHVKEGDFVEQGQLVASLSSKNEGVQVSALVTQVDLENEKLTSYRQYEKSLNNKTNYMSKNKEKELYEKVEYYMMQIEKDNKINKKKEEDITLKNNEINEYKAKLKDEDTYEMQSIKEYIKTKENELRQLNSQSELQADLVKNQLLTDLGTKLSTSEDKIAQLNAQISIYQAQDQSLNLNAVASGYIHFITQIDDGVAIQGFQPIAEIQGSENTKLVVEGYVDAIERSKIEVGNDVKIAIAGVNQTKYGTLNGKLTHIDNGIMMQKSSEGSKPYYKIIVEFEEHKLVASDGTTIDITNSMLNEVRIIYDKESYFEWILDQLNLTK